MKLTRQSPHLFPLSSFSSFSCVHRHQSDENPVGVEWSPSTTWPMEGSHSEHCASTAWPKVRTRTCISCSTQANKPWCVVNPLQNNSSKICVEVHVRRNYGVSYTHCHLSGCKGYSSSEDENISSIYVEGDNEVCGHVVKFPAIIFPLIGIAVFTFCIFVALCLCCP